MRAIGEYTLGIGAAAIVCAITLSFAGKGSMQPLMKLICGLILAFSVIRPVLAIASGDWKSLGLDCRREADQAVELGKELGREVYQDSIRSRTEAYILEKARHMGLRLQVQVTLGAGETPLPEKVCIQGEVSPYDRQKLAWILREELGIQEENQIWN